MMNTNAAPGAIHEMRALADDPVLLYDGTCALCARSVQFVLRHERTSSALRFGTLQGPHGLRALSENPALTGVDSVIWVEPSTDHHHVALVRSDAVIAILEHLGGRWTWLARMGRLMPKVSRDALYRVVARYRYRLFGHDGTCMLPTAEQRARFLD